MGRIMKVHLQYMKLCNFLSHPAGEFEAVFSREKRHVLWSGKSGEF
jgi:hypothetical protein